MIGDPRHSRFFALTALFTAAMTVLVMSRNLLLTFIFWEVMGLCSYLLISHYAERLSAARAATKVFLVNSVADVGLGLGVILTFLAFGTLDIPEILAIARAGGEVSTTAVTVLTLCLFTGAVGKSAQMPAHVWLPFAMEAPTPVSALIHAATMVNAGPFLLVRLSPVIVLSQTAMTVIAVIGATTALFAAVVSLTQSDVKRTLAYSTISQLGFMTMLCGVGAFVAAIFHMLAHGFFKGFLFLSTGNVLAATERRINHPEHGHSRAMGGLFAGAFVLSAIPPLLFFSGPYRDLWTSQGFTAANARAVDRRSGHGVFHGDVSRQEPRIGVSSWASGNGSGCDERHARVVVCEGTLPPLSYVRRRRRDRAAYDLALVRRILIAGSRRCPVRHIGGVLGMDADSDRSCRRWMGRRPASQLGRSSCGYCSVAEAVLRLFLEQRLFR